MNMTYSKDGIELTKSFEKCRLTPYRDSGGVATNGFGNTHHVDMTGTITQAQADADLVMNLQGAVGCVNYHVTMDVSQHQFDALVDLTYNIGCGAFRGSTLLRLLNAGNIQGAHDQFARWNKIKGTASLGLIRRREGEIEFFDDK